MHLLIFGSTGPTGRHLIDQALAQGHAVTAFAAVIMSGIVIVSLLYRPASRFRGTIGWTSLSLLVMYFASTYAVYLYGGL